MSTDLTIPTYKLANTTFIVRNSVPRSLVTSHRSPFSLQTISSLALNKTPIKKTLTTLTIKKMVIQQKNVPI